jgi:arsenate reductase (glutaredoxin)
MVTNGLPANGPALLAKWRTPLAKQDFGFADPGEMEEDWSRRRVARGYSCGRSGLTDESAWLSRAESQQSGDNKNGEQAMPVTIYHNPRCNTSRKTLELLRGKGVEPDIVEYLKTPYTAAQLKTLLGQLGLPAKAIVRKKEAAAAGVDPAKLSEDQLVAAMAKNPIIVERPIVVSGGKAALGRPPENVLKVL